jgi:hypothetical protein
MLDTSGGVQKLRSLVKLLSLLPPGVSSLMVWADRQNASRMKERGRRLMCFRLLVQKEDFFARMRSRIGRVLKFLAYSRFMLYLPTPFLMKIILLVGTRSCLLEKTTSLPYLHISNGRIVRVDYIFDNSIESLNAILRREIAGLIFAPVAH